MAESRPLIEESPDHSHHHHHDGRGGWLAGTILILIGVVFLLQRFGVVVFFGGWWGLILYLIALALFANAWRSYRGNGRPGRSVTGSLIAGLILAVVGTIALFGLAWDLWWPVVLVAIGTGLVFGELVGRRGAPRV